MNPIYKFELTAGETAQRAFPVYKDDLAKDFEKESGQEFFRAKLSGNLTFQSDDYTFIVSQAFDMQFILEIFISYNAGQSWTSYWRGTFWKTDCEFDDDAKTVSVKPTVLDQYNDVLAGMDKEYNLIELAPEIVPVRADKRPMIQVYVPGQSVIGCFLSGMWWEQEVEPESDTNKLEQQFYFAQNKTQRVVDVLEKGSLDIPDVFTGAAVVQTNAYEFTNGDYKFQYVVESGSYWWQIVRVSDETILWFANRSTVPAIPYELTLGPNTAAGVTGNVKIYIHDFSVYARMICDVEKIGTVNTYPIPDNDLVENNRNYSRVVPYNFPNTIYFSTRLTSTPTKWGIYQPGEYYQEPYTLATQEFFPVARSAWGRVSIWFAFGVIDILFEQYGRSEFSLKDAYPLSSVLSVLLAKIAPGISHSATETYSQFLYGTPFMKPVEQTLFITPKSNIISSNYDQPAQQAPITLRDILNMLRDCFRCYWFIDENNRFRIEHIYYFMHGGTYTGGASVGIDLTTQKVPRNGKEWAFARSQYKFEKPEMASRYQFGWMDDVTELFDGPAIDIISKFVEPGNTEDVTVSRFTSDIDYILLNPSEISKDGFVLLSAQILTYLDETEWNRVTLSTPYAVTVSGWSEGETVNIILQTFGSASNIMRLNFLDASDSVISQIGLASISSSLRTNIFRVVVPEGATQIQCVLLSATGYADVLLSVNGGYRLPYRDFYINGSNHILQNGLVAFIYLQNYYVYDMPAPFYEINGQRMYAAGVKKLKTQSLNFPVLNDPDLVQLVKTNLGNGTIEKLSVNLSSRNANATLKYDTE